MVAIDLPIRLAPKSKDLDGSARIAYHSIGRTDRIETPSGAAAYCYEF